MGRKRQILEGEEDSVKKDIKKTKKDRRDSSNNALTVQNGTALTKVTKDNKVTTINKEKKTPKVRRGSTHDSLNHQNGDPVTKDEKVKNKPKKSASSKEGSEDIKNGSKGSRKEKPLSNGASLNDKAVKKTEKKAPKKSKKVKAEEVEDIIPNMSGAKIVMKIPNLMKATVVNRPSKVVRSPYMADIILHGETEAQLCHSPALGCSGLIVTGSSVLVTPKNSASAKSKFSLDLINLGSTVVGANPNFCNKMVRIALERGWVDSLPAFQAKEIKGEVTLDESRFDFKCEKDGTVYYIEVKGVPNASSCDPPLKPSPKKKTTTTTEVHASQGNSKIAYFPDGYRKAANDPISPRALKHVNHLRRLCTEENTVCALVFVVQRSDCHIFQPTKNDPIYRKAVYEAKEAGVRIIPHSVTWEDGEAVWKARMDMNLKDASDMF